MASRTAVRNGLPSQNSQCSCLAAELFNQRNLQFATFFSPIRKQSTGVLSLNPELPLTISYFLRLKEAVIVICCSLGHVDDFPHVLLSWPSAPEATTGSDGEAAGRQMDSQRTSKEMPHQQILPFPISIQMEFPKFTNTVSKTISNANY